MKTLIYLLLGLTACSCNSAFTGGENKKETEAESPYTPLQSCLLNHMSHPVIDYPALLGQATGSKARVYKFDQSSANIYCSIDFEVLDDRSHLSKICLDTATIVFGDHLDEYISIDGLVLPDSLGMIFRFPADQLTADTTRRLSGGDYSLTLAEAIRWHQNQYVYNGPVLFSPEPTNTVIIPNLTPTIAMPGSPSLRRLVHKIVDRNSSKEVQAQQLLDFVSEEIALKSSGQYEIFFRPHEMLLSQKADVRGKQSLYASLLAQAEIPYLLVYLELGTTIAVRGDFTNNNRLSFLHEGQEYSLAEPSVESFVIGQTEMVDEYKWSKARYVQYPGKETRLFDLLNQDSLDFGSVEIPLSQ
ncbi:MAG: hypothetical protein AAF927_05915 [Bacteroidota bacterium]